MAPAVIHQTVLTKHPWSSLYPPVVVGSLGLLNIPTLAFTVKLLQRAGQCFANCLLLCLMLVKLALNFAFRHLSYQATVEECRANPGREIMQNWNFSDMGPTWARKQQKPNKSQIADNVYVLAICWGRFWNKIIQAWSANTSSSRIAENGFDHASSPWQLVEPLTARLVQLRL